MMLKNSLLSIIAGVAAFAMAAAVAGGPDAMPAPAHAKGQFYFEGSVGYGFQDYSDRIHVDSAYALVPINNQIPVLGPQGDGTTGGIVYGADFGYLFTPHLGVELGWTYLPRFVGALAPGGYVSGFAVGSFASVDLRNTGAAWLVAKLVAPLTHHFDVFFKGGVSYKYGSLVWNGANGERSTPTSISFVPAKSKIREWRPVFGAGLTYKFAEQWMASVQWMHFMGGKTYIYPEADSRFLSIVTPASDLLTLVIGYKFTV